MTESQVCIAVEVKLYGESSALRERGLLGEIRQAIRELPNLDLWVLATTAEIPDLQEKALQIALAEFGCSFLSLSFADGSTTCPSSLDVLAALAEPAFLRYLVDEEAHKAAAAKLAEIRAVAVFDAARKTLRKRLLRPETGFETWRRAQNRGMRWYLKNPDAVKPNLGLDIAVEAPDKQLIPRRHAETALDTWWQRWPGDRRPMVVLGGEGDGKSWAVASWLATRLRDDPFPAVLFISSRLCTTQVPAALFASQTEMVLRDSMEPRGDSWLSNLARSSLETWKKNQWARTWFTRFVEEPDDVKANAAWLLMLRCVDRRFWFWKDIPFDRLSHIRRAFYYNNEDDLKRQIKNNEKDREDRLFGERISKGTIAPWLEM